MFLSILFYENCLLRKNGVRSVWGTPRLATSLITTTSDDLTPRHPPKLILSRISLLRRALNRLLLFPHLPSPSSSPPPRLLPPPSRPTSHRTFTYLQHHRYHRHRHHRRRWLRLPPLTTRAPPQPHIDATPHHNRALPPPRSQPTPPPQAPGDPSATRTAHAAHLTHRHHRCH